MMSAPEKIFVTERPTLMRMGACHVHKLTGADEYHLTRTASPYSTDEFLSRLYGWVGDEREGVWESLVFSAHEKMGQWLAGDFAAAMEGLE